MRVGGKIQLTLKTSRRFDKPFLCVCHENFLNTLKKKDKISLFEIIPAYEYKKGFVVKFKFLVSSP